MDNRAIASYQEKLEQVVDKHRDFLGEEAERLCVEHSVPAAKRLQEELAAIADEERLLKIGIVGRVKSGKSSLLNALIFKGQNVLPKAATPMTAALTTLSYGDVVQAEVEFFTREDIGDIEAKAAEYERQLQKHTDALLKKEKSKLSLSVSPEKRERVQRRAARKMRDEHPVLASSYEQRAKMNEQRAKMKDVSSLGESKLLNLTDDLSALQGQLEEYVGADGPYMPFTKSVNIRLPQENLKDIEIVDTPGINDPVQSREIRTREHLDRCDVVLVVSPAGQFMNKVDEDLMDRITSKEGIRELFVVAAQADMQLYGSAKEENDGQLDRVLGSITEDLGGYLKEVIVELKKNNPEVADTYDQLLDGQNRIIHSSGICESLKQLFGERDGWDEGMEYAWDRLQGNYPDYFSTADASLSSINLDKLSNISAIRDIVEKVRERKDDIREEKIAAYVDDKSRALQDLRAGLLKFAEDRQGEIESTDITRFKEKRRELDASLKGAALDIEDAKDESVDHIEKSMKDELVRRVTEEELKGKVRDEQGERTEDYKEGIIFKKTRTRRHKTIRTRAVVNHLSGFSEDLVWEVAEKADKKKEDWRKELNRSMTNVLREHFDDDLLESSMIRRVIRSTVGAISMPDFKYDNRLPPELKAQGVLEDKKAEAFFNAACDHASTLCRELKKETRAYIKRFTSEMKKIPLERLLLEQFQKELDSLEESIRDKEMELKRINLIKGELKRIE